MKYEGISLIFVYFVWFLMDNKRYCVCVDIRFLMMVLRCCSVRFCLLVFILYWSTELNKRYQDPESYLRWQKIDSNFWQNILNQKFVVVVVDRSVFFFSVLAQCFWKEPGTLLSYCSYFPLNDFEFSQKHCVAHFWHDMLNRHPMNDSQLWWW